MGYLAPIQAAVAETTPWETKLAGAIEEVFGGGRHDLPGLVEGLNELGIPAPGGGPWTPEGFTTAIAELAAAGKQED
ncbi:hypothetical protein OG984_08355 [Nocardioides sp. NBC_00368]|uniref:recombinase-like helix-turn-helix domain-containing protein n=1 Tax=Nocardioides sp. NBC_00368 TaxID=2976000 RepID=UPI002E207467